MFYNSLKRVGILSATYGVYKAVIVVQEDGLTTGEIVYLLQE